MNSFLPTRWLSVLAAALISTSAASAAIVYTNDFTADAEGWDAGTGNMTVGWTDDQGQGLPLGSLEGSFDAQSPFLPLQQGSFRMDELGNNFLGEYDNVITGFTFDFMALSVLPTDLSLNLYSGGDAYYIPVVLSGMSVGVWKQFTISLADVNWVGSESVLDVGVTSIELTVTRGSTVAQMFYLDNFATVGTDFGGGGGESVVPEPATLMMLGCSWLVLYAMRKKIRQQAAQRESAA